MTHTPSTIRALLAEHGLEPSRALGQNFVADPNTVRRIVRLAAVAPGDRVVEIGAGLGTKAHGIPSVKASWWADVRLVGKVSPHVFVPAPRVESALVEIVRHPVDGDEAERAAVFALVEAGYNQRRKMLRRALAGKVTADAFERAHVRPEARGEELSLADWRRLAAAAAT